MKSVTIKVIFIIVVIFIFGILVGIFINSIIIEDEEDNDISDFENVLIFNEPYSINIKPSDFVYEINNTYLPYKPGTKFIYEGETDEGFEHIEVLVTNETRMIMGIKCVIVRDTVTLDGEIIEDPFDWFAQDKFGNVWYLGEDSKELEDGEVVSTEGSWESGKDGALPGIIMFAQPNVGITYRQEYYKGEAEDMATIVSLNEEMEINNKKYENLLKVKEFTPLEPDVVEYKYYAPGIGVIFESSEDGSEKIVLKEIITI